MQQRTPPAETSEPEPQGSSPRRVARRQAILDAARELFLERGYDGISMGDVVERAGGSLATVYSCFGSKEGLFDAILDELSAEIAAPLHELAIGRQAPREALQRLGE